MIARNRCEANAGAVEIGTAIPNIDDIRFCANHERRRERRSHLLSPLAPTLVDRLVGPFDAAYQHLDQVLVIDIIAGHDVLQHHLHHTLNGDAAGLLPIRVTAHAISDDEKAEGHEASVKRACPLQHYQAIFVGVALPRDACIPAHADLQRLNQARSRRSRWGCQRATDGGVTRRAGRNIMNGSRPGWNKRWRCQLRWLLKPLW